jgi:hypothetical protein
VERIAPGAFDEALKADVLALYNHANDNILGRKGAGTLRLSVDARGLRYEIDPPNSDIGQRVVEAVRRGDVAGASFGFAPVEQSWTDSPGLLIRELKRVRLYDVGPVNKGAYPSASASVRSLDGLDEALDEIDRRYHAAKLRRRIAADLAAAGLPTR